MAIQRILVASDFSDGANLAFATALELATKLGASIHVLNVVEDPLLPAAVSPDVHAFDLARLRDAVVNDGERRMAEIVKAHPDALLTTEVVHGRPASTIVETAAREKFDLIVVGTHGRGGVSRLMGSVAERVVRMARCAVLTVRAADAASRR
jgi:universal stress protein A